MTNIQFQDVVLRKLHRSRVKIVSEIRKLKIGIWCAHTYTPDRLLWLTRYIEEVHGAHQSFILKLPVDHSGQPLPWYTYPAIEYLKQFDFSACDIFEYGSGNSSKFWAQGASTVTSVESDRSWYEIGIIDLDLNRNLLLETDKNAYVNTIHRNELLYDVVVIDGLYRFDCTREAIKRVKPGGFVILDNSDWHPNTAKQLRNAGFTQVDFVGVGPINSYAWCTSFFFQHMLTIPRKCGSQPVQVLGGLQQISQYDNSSL